MPRRRNYAKKYLAKRKRRTQRAALTTVNRGVAPITPRFITRMRYTAQDITLASVSGVLADYSFRLNSLFDPDLTGVGHQPLGRDQMAQFYNRYRVFAASWKITTFPTGSAGTLVVLPSNDATSLASVTPSTIMEQGRSIAYPLSVRDAAIHTGRINLADLTGVSAATYKADDRYASDMSTNPVETMVLHVMQYAAVGATNSVIFNIEMTMHAELFDPIDLLAS